MKCPQCQVMNGDQRSFCKRCGGRIRVHCHQCAFFNEVDDAYCGGCGASLSGTLVPPGESRIPAPQSYVSNPSSLLAEILKEVPPPPPPAPPEVKKGVSQEEIDQLFK